MTRKCCTRFLLVFLTFLAAVTPWGRAEAFASDFRFIILSDTHTSPDKPGHNARFQEALDRLQAYEPEFVLFTGDILEGCSEENVRLFDELRGRLSCPSYVVPGNHDVGQKVSLEKGVVTSASVKRYVEAFGYDRFAFGHEGFYFIGINNVILSSGLPEEAEQFEWFQARLEEAGSRHVFVVCHYPFFLRCPDESEGTYWTVDSPAREEWLSLFAPGKVRAVWSGHLHRFSDAVWWGISFVTTPALSFSCAADKGLTGFRVVHVCEDGWRSEFVDLRTEGGPPEFPEIKARLREEFMKQEDVFRLGVIADTHMGPPCRIPRRKSELAIPLLERVVRRFNEEISPDAVVLLGDVLDDGSTDETPGNLGAVKDALSGLSCPFLVIPGNHDRPTESFAEVFGPYPRRLDVGSASIVGFEDRYGEGDKASREEEDLVWLSETIGSLKPLRVAIQHTPLYPDIESGYPYNLTNREEVHAGYKEAGIVLSLSGHYHPGLEPVLHDGIWYAVAPALCEEPFRYAVFEIEGESVKWEYGSLGTVAELLREK